MTAFKNYSTYALPYTKWKLTEKYRIEGMKLNEKESFYGKSIRVDYELEELLDIFRRGIYTDHEGTIKKMPYALLQLSEAKVFLPETIYGFFDSVNPNIDASNKGNIRVVKTDTLSAVKQLEDAEVETTILNFAHPNNPGGSIRRLGRADVAQEENICSSTSLILSLESSNAQKFYEYHTNPSLGSDAVLYSPYVLLFDRESRKIQKISCVSAAAPMCSVFSNRIEDYSDKDMDRLWERRWASLLVVLQHLEKKNIILGGWGTGAFSNSVERVAKMAREVLFAQGFRFYFNDILFAIPDDKKCNVFSELLEE